MRGKVLLETMLQDAGYALRCLRRSPGLTTVVVISLALGIGANTAIYSLVDAVLLRMLPVADPKELSIVTLRGRPGAGIFSYPFFRELRQNNEAFSGVLAHNAVPVSLVTRGRPERGVADLVSGSFFSVLAVRPQLGRLLTDDDDRTPLGHPVAVISYNFWKQKLSADASVIGKTIRIDSFPFTIVGVAPRGFFGVVVGTMPDVWVPMMMQPQIFNRGNMAFDAPNWGWLSIIGRRKPGISETQALASLKVRFAQILQDDRMASFFGRQRDVRIGLLPGGQGESRLRGMFEDPLRLLMVIVVMLLLITCANIATLLLARGTARRKEIALRLALGAGRLRLIRQLLTESTLLGVLGGLLGLALAFWFAGFLVRFLPQDHLPRALEITLDWRVLGFALAVSLATGILFGLAPAVYATRRSLAPALKDDVSALPGARRRLELRNLLVISQVALSLPLLICAALFVRTLRNVKAIDTGINTEGVLLVTMNPADNGYTPEQIKIFYQELGRRVESLGSVRSVGFAQAPLLSGGYSQVGMRVPGRAQPPGGVSILLNLISAQFLETAGIPLALGRDFGPQDTPESQRVAIINEKAARYFFGDENPVGRRVRLGGQDGVEIIGIARDAKYRSVREETPRTAYLGYEQERRQPGGRTLYARTTGDPALLISAVRREVQALDPDLPLYNVKTFADQKNESLARERLVAMLSGFFATLGLLLASIGLYGVMAYAVVRRTREIGIRMALGAARWDVLRMVLREAVLLVAIGTVIGVCVALWACQLIAGQLFGVRPTDPATILLATLVLLVTATLAGYLPARRASRVDPMVALRYE